MLDFVTAYVGLAPECKMTNRELSRAIRVALCAEHEAIHLLQALADATDQPLARAVLQDVANEERIHVGQFGRLLEILTGDEDDWLGAGAAEVDELAAEFEHVSRGPLTGPRHGAWLGSGEVLVATGKGYG